MEPWQLGALANGVVTAAYLGIVAAILTPLVRSNQLRENRLGTATAGIFLTCAVAHGAHVAHLLLPAVGLEEHAGLHLRAAWEWHTVTIDVAGAAVGVYYWSLRKTYGSLMKGAKLFEDMKERERQALQINDDIVQGLTVAHMALALDDRKRSEEVIESTLASARKLISDLVGESDAAEGKLRPGDLRRAEPALIRGGSKA